MMSSGVTNTTTWTASSVSDIDNFVSGLSCLDDCGLHISSQNTSEIWVADGSTTETVTWDVNGSNETGGCPIVDILLSVDGGGSFPITLASGTSNDGSHSFVIQVMPSTLRGRVKVVCNGNGINDINNTDIEIESSCNPPARPSLVD